MSTEYKSELINQFKDLEIRLHSHDTSSAPGALPAYIEVTLGYAPKDKGLLVLDLGNYIYSCLGLTYQHRPEYRGRGKKTTVRWFMDWNDFEKIRLNVLKAYGKEHMLKIERYVPFEFRSLIIQNTKRGVVGPTATQERTA